MSSVRTAVIPAAGLGTRILPATKVLAKELLPLVDTPAIQVVVQEALAAGLTDIILVISKGKEVLLEHFAPAPALEALLEERGKTEDLARIRDLAAGATLRAVYQDEPRGLGHAVLCAAELVGEQPCCVLLADDLTDSQSPCLPALITAYAATGAGCIALEALPEETLHTKGVVGAEELGKLGREALTAAGVLPEALGRYWQLTALVEKPPAGTAPSNLGILGRYCLPPAIFPLLAATAPGRGGEIQLTDALIALQRQQGLLGYVYPGRRWDTGNRLGYLEAQLALALDRPDLREDVLALLRVLLDQESGR